MEGISARLPTCAFLVTLQNPKATFLSFLRMHILIEASSLMEDMFNMGDF